MFDCNQNKKEKTRGILEGEFVYVYGCYNMRIKE